MKRVLNVPLARYYSHYRNSAGIYHLQDDIRTQVFKRSIKHEEPSDKNTALKVAPKPEKRYKKKEVKEVRDTKEMKAKRDINQIKRELEKISLQHLADNGLLNQKTSVPEHLDIEIPPILGNSLDEHFQKIGKLMCEPYLDICNEFLAFKPTKFSEFKYPIQMQSGWTKYTPDKAPEKVDFPTDKAIVFDVETLPLETEFAIMATAVSADAWYVWLSPWILRETDNSRQLVPLGTHEQVVIGHYVGFDRKRVLEEYSLIESKKWFMDTMSFHIAINGMCNQQRLTYLELQSLLKEPEKNSAKIAKLKKRDPWLEKTSRNGLDDCVKFYLNTELSKATRNIIMETRREQIRPNLLRMLIFYCSNDTYYTKLVFDEVFPVFLKKNPHPVSIGSLRFLSQLFLPITEDWCEYVDTCDEYYDQMQGFVSKNLEKLAVEASQIKDMETVKANPWFRQLDWTVKPIRYTKGTEKTPPRMVKNQKLPGMPQWFKDIHPGKELKLTPRTRTSVLLLQLTFDNNPFVWSDKHGWCFNAPNESEKQYLSENLTKVTDLEDVDIEPDTCLFKLPHPNGSKSRCTNPFAKFYTSYFDSGEINSSNKLAADALAMNSECTYWIASRQRIQNQMAVFQKDLPTDIGVEGLILPRVAPTGTVTRRAVEDTWLTASNAKKNRLGSELKSKIQAPPGYSIVGADVDSEELWIASVVGDSLFNIHGGTALGWMTLEGDKEHGTDLHSKSAKILGISRNEAKIFNYGRIYGAGETSASRNLKQFNKTITQADADAKAKDLYSATRGSRIKSKNFALKTFLAGGSESVIYNQLELLANQQQQRTPILGSEITAALANENTTTMSLQRTRVNWTIQSSGVDYLHLLIASMFYLTKVYDIKVRLMLTVHDEVRFLTKDEDKYRAALALQISNLWTRSLFCEQLGFDNIPANIAFFSLVDIDKVLRKEVNDACITPSQPIPLNSGVALSISQLLEKCRSLGPANTEVIKRFDAEKAVERRPLLESIKIPHLLSYAEAQISTPRRAYDLDSSANYKSSRMQFLKPRNMLKFRSRNSFKVNAFPPRRMNLSRN